MNKQVNTEVKVFLILRPSGISVYDAARWEAAPPRPRAAEGACRGAPPSSVCPSDTGRERRADHGTRASREVSGTPRGDLYPHKNSSHIESEDPGVTPSRYFPYS